MLSAETKRATRGSARTRLSSELQSKSYAENRNVPKDESAVRLNLSSGLACSSDRLSNIPNQRQRHGRIRISKKVLKTSPRTRFLPLTCRPQLPMIQLLVHLHYRTTACPMRKISSNTLTLQSRSK